MRNDRFRVILDLPVKRASCVDRTGEQTIATCGKDHIEIAWMYSDSKVCPICNKEP